MRAALIKRVGLIHSERANCESAGLILKKCGKV